MSFSLITGEALESRMREMGLTQVSLGRKAGVSQSQVSRFCAGQFRRRSANLKKVLRVLKMDVESGSEEELVEAVRALARERPGKVAALRRTLSAIRDLIA